VEFPWKRHFEGGKFLETASREYWLQDYSRGKFK
jgi:hypothetical protein